MKVVLSTPVELASSAVAPVVEPGIAGITVGIDCALTPDSQQVLFAGRDADGPAGLYLTTLTAEPAPPVELSLPGEVVRAFVVR